MKTFSYLLIALFVAFAIVSCQKEDEINPNDKNTVTLEFDNRVGDQKLVLGTTSAKNALNEDFTVTRLNYFVSNISLKNENGTVVKFPNKYFLVKHSDPNSWLIKLEDVPAGNYNEVSYMIGVDSLKSVSDVSQRTGVLDPASYGDDNMYWSWNMGYIFFKMEGKSSAIPMNMMNMTEYQFHVGGFGGMTGKTPNNLKTITLPMTTAAQVRGSVAPQIHIINDVQKVFSGVNQVSIAKSYMTHAPEAGIPIGQNYAKSFIVDHVHNEKD
ncbi:MbnP family protein [Emticicia sp. 17c]|uniref:MbnP family protein n=1 Tax=Emticicia sp. 17c TaxID=3127704 RepID=UPI00301BE686